MKKYITLIVFSMLVLSGISCHLYGQERKKVSVTILDKRTGKPFDKDEVIFEIFGFNTVALAEDAKAVLDKEQFGVITPDVEVLPPDETGFFTATLPPNGALLIRTGITKVLMEPIDYRSEIKIYIQAHEILDPVTMEVKMTSITPDSEEPEMMGNHLVGACQLFIPEKMGRTDARLIMQPVFIDAETNDTLLFLEPWVFDGEEYAMTQERRMAYNPGYDPLNRYVREDTLTSEHFSFMWRDTVYLEDPTKICFVRGKILVEDYHRVYYVEDSIYLASSRIRRPMRFLEYNIGGDEQSYETYSPETYDSEAGGPEGEAAGKGGRKPNAIEYKKLDPAGYYVKPKPVNMEEKGEMSLTFLVNKAELDNKNPMNAILLDSLKSALRSIHSGETTRLKELNILGISSPEGPYGKNMTLAKLRSEFAAEQVFSSIPKYYRDRMNYHAAYEVAPWSAVVALLEKDGRSREAAEVQEIVQNTEGHDAQGAKITKLSYYRPLIVPLLPQLRTVKYTYKYDELREMRADEVYELYLTDEAYRSGEKHFELYQYWHLFNLVEDPEEAMALYRRAYDETTEDFGKPWVLAANHLAYAMLVQGMVDTTILAPLIDTRFRSNRTVRDAYGVERLSNEAEMVANQLCMFLKSNNFSRASVMAKMLPDDEEYKVFKAMTMCLGGYYKGGTTEEDRMQRAEWMEMVMSTSTRNKVVVLLAQNTRGHNAMARRAIEELPQDDALTWYFKAIISGRECKYDDCDPMEPLNFVEYLKKCFDLDSSFIAIARDDGDINERELQLFFKDYPEYSKI